MKLEQQVVRPELAQKLKELRVKQESFFIWKQCINKQLACYQIPTVSTHKNVDNDDEIIASAFTVAELGEMLPASVSFTKEISSGKDNYVCIHWTPEVKEFAVYADTEADARAKMLVYLLENKLITL